MVKLATIKDITAERFVIPDFQRDYAWERQHLALMLGDIMEACKLGKARYVLGPLVVADRGGEAKVVDGQQRLTSLVIILKALGEGNVGFLDFENREHTKKMLGALSKRQGGSELNNLINSHHTCQKIWDMYQFALEYFARSLNEGGKGKGGDCIKKEDFLSYLMERVCFIEKRLGEDAEIQHTFEVLNTAGLQLKKEDVAKAKLIADIVGLKRERDAELFNYAWMLCCDIERDLDEIDGHTTDTTKKRIADAKRIKAIHAASSLDDLHDAMKGLVGTSGEAMRVSLDDVAARVEGGKLFTRGRGSSGRCSGYPTGEYAPCLTPYQFLDTVLLASLGKSISDIANPAKGDAYIATPSDALKVIKALLIYRIALDSLVVRRRKNEWNWEIKAKIGTKEERRQLILIESMMAVSGVEACRTLINAAKVAQDAALAKDEAPSAAEIVKPLEEYAINRTKDELGSLDSGVGAKHFPFHWLDYLLALNPPEEIKKQAMSFSFVDTSSVEHLLPQNPLEGREYTEEEWAMMDTFGNLALVTPSINSLMSNLSPEQKVNEAHRDGWRVVSLKYELMLQIAEREGWSPAACKEHGEAMKGVLANGLQTTVDSV